MWLKEWFDDIRRLRNEVTLLKSTVTTIQHMQKQNMDEIKNMFWAAQGSSTIRKAQEAFWKRYPKAIGDLRAVQQANLILLKKLREICIQKGIVMWLSGGTLIGAIRHQGFIPWDDDVDVCVTRNDLNQLQKSLEGSEFQIREYFHDRYCSRGLQFCYQDQRIPNFIDVCVFDYCNCDGLSRRTEYLGRFRQLQGEMLHEFIHRLGAPKVEDVGMQDFGPYSPENKRKVEALISQYQEKLGVVEKGNSLFYAIDNYPFGYPVMASEDILNVKTVPFEDTVMDIPNKAEIYLQGYGDIYQIPADMGQSQHIYAFEPYMDKIHYFLEGVNT